MTTKKITAKEFGTIAKSAKKQIKDVTFSPFFICNTLNKVAKGDVSKIDGCNTINVEDVKRVAKVCKTLHGGRYAFDFSLFEKDSTGRFCTRVQLPKVYAFDTIGDSVTYTFHNCDVLIGENVYLKPVPCTFIGMFASFAKVAKVELSESEKVARAEKKAKEESAKYAKKLASAKSAVRALFGELCDTFSDEEILAKYAIIKSTK